MPNSGHHKVFVAEELDVDAVGRYAGAVGLQVATVTAVLGAADTATGLVTGGEPLPWQAATAIFFLLSPESRTFSPLALRVARFRDRHRRAFGHDVHMDVESPAAATLAENRILDCGSTGIEVDGGCHDLSVVRNTISDCAGVGMLVRHKVRTPTRTRGANENSATRRTRELTRRRGNATRNKTR